MRRTLVLAIPVLLGVGVWQFFQHFDIEQGPQGIQVRPRSTSSLPVEHGASAVAPGIVRRDTLRLASFDVQPLGEQKLAKPLLAKVLAQTLRRFDLVALQGIQATAEDVLAGLVQIMNQDGRGSITCWGSAVSGPCPTPSSTRSFSIPKPSRPTASRCTRCMIPTTCCARSRWWLLSDALGGPEKQAFTFTLINVCIDPARAAEELSALGNVFRAVRDDGRGEDDILLVGDFQADDRRLMTATSIPYLGCCIVGLPTTTRRTQQSDNIVFDHARPRNSPITQACSIFNRSWA